MKERRKLEKELMSIAHSLSFTTTPKTKQKSLIFLRKDCKGFFGKQ
jgi:hypothetical protein